MKNRTFYDEPLPTIITFLTQYLQQNNLISFNVLNPDLYDVYAGSHIEIKNKIYCYRPLKSWIDLAELLRCKLLIPHAITDTLVKLTFKKLQQKNSFHLNTTSLPQNEKYGKNSHFFSINKMEEPAFYYYYKEALENVNIKEKKSILNLGVNKADEFEVIQTMVSSLEFEKKKFVGIDFSISAIQKAQKKFKNHQNVTFYIQDLNDINRLEIGRFELLISIGTLQSSTLNFKPFFMSLVQKYLNKENSAIILGFPNSRWVGGELLYGAKVPHYAMSEMGLVLSDIMFCKKYLQQHKYRVTITGKYYLFLTATKILS